MAAIFFIGFRGFSPYSSIFEINPLRLSDAIRYDNGGHFVYSVSKFCCQFRLWQSFVRALVVYWCRGIFLFDVEVEV